MNERLTRWILGHTQPAPYSLDLDHPALADIAWAADRIQELESGLQKIASGELCENQTRHVALSLVGR